MTRPSRSSLLLCGTLHPMYPSLVGLICPLSIPLTTFIHWRRQSRRSISPPSGALLTASHSLHEKLTEKNGGREKLLDTGEAEMVMPIMEQTRTSSNSNFRCNVSTIKSVVETVIDESGDSGHGACRHASKSQSKSPSARIGISLDLRLSSAMLIE